MSTRRAGLALCFLAISTGVTSPASANQYTFVWGEDVIGRTSHVIARQADTLSDLARAHGVGYEEIVMANRGVDPWLPREGTKVTIPDRHVLPNAPRNGIVLNVAELRLYYFPRASSDEARTVVTYPISVGRVDWRTPLGTTSIVRKQTDPVWTPPASIKREHALDGDILPDSIGPGDENPLGRHALYLGVSGYLIHGTNKPYGIGMRVTHGCIRLYPEDVELLFQQVPVGTAVHLVDQPYKAGWSDGVLYLEAYPPFGENRDGAVNHLAEMVPVVMEATRAYPDYPIDWRRAEAEVLDPTGMPVAIGPRLPPEQRVRQAEEPQPQPTLKSEARVKGAPARPSRKAPATVGKAQPRKAAVTAATPAKAVAQTAKKETPPQRGSQANRSAR